MRGIDASQWKIQIPKQNHLMIQIDCLANFHSFRERTHGKTSKLASVSLTPE
jgi:hypothetical protein